MCKTDLIYQQPIFIKYGNHRFLFKGRFGFEGVQPHVYFFISAQEERFPDELTFKELGDKRIFLFNGLELVKLHNFKIKIQIMI
jgi:hypothetical protein